MRYFIGVTDDKWFERLSNLKPDEVNFWRPGGRQSFRAISPGAPFLFKLHSPHDFIVGGGFFVRHSNIPLSLAWEAFGQKNGAETQELLLKMVNRHRREPDRDPTIGCTILTQPFFLPREEWIAAPGDWSKNIVQGKTYDTLTEFGGRIWEQVRHRVWTESAEAAAEAESRYGAEFLTRGRLGQGTFRILVTEAYGRNCAITSEKTLPVLEAAHILPFANEGPNVTSNGLLLRSDLHTLFDLGYLTVTPELNVEVSRTIKERFKNGKNYYSLHGRRLAVIPESEIERPNRTYLEWHNQNRYLA